MFTRSVPNPCHAGPTWILLTLEISKKRGGVPAATGAAVPAVWGGLLWGEGAPDPQGVLALWALCLARTPRYSLTAKYLHRSPL